MNSRSKYYLAVFKSKNHAIQLYYALDRKGLYNKFQVVSTPCEIKAGCNYSIRFYDYNDLNILNDEAKELFMTIDEVYSIEKKDGKKITKKISWFT